jgi:hypothetical protein
MPEDAIASRLSYGHHHLARRREGDLVRLRLRFIQLIACDIDLLARHDERGL